MRKFDPILIVSLLVCFSPGLTAKPILKFLAVDLPYVREHVVEIVKRAYQDIGYTLTVEYDGTGRAQLISDSGNFDGDLVRVDSFKKLVTQLKKVNTSLGTIQVFLVCSTKVDDCSQVVLDDPNLSIVTVPGVNVLNQSVSGKAIKKIQISQVNKLTEMLRMNRIKYSLVLKHKESGEFLLNITGLKVSEHVLHEEKLYHFLHVRHEHLIPPLELALKREISRLGWNNE